MRQWDPTETFKPNKELAEAYPSEYTHIIIVITIITYVQSLRYNTYATTFHACVRNWKWQKGYYYLRPVCESDNSDSRTAEREFSRNMILLSFTKICHHIPVWWKLDNNRHFTRRPTRFCKTKWLGVESEGYTDYHVYVANGHVRNPYSAAYTWGNPPWWRQPTTRNVKANDPRHLWGHSRHPQRSNVKYWRTRSWIVTICVHFVTYLLFHVKGQASCGYNHSVNTEGRAFFFRFSCVPRNNLLTGWSLRKLQSETLRPTH
jgi:hypothetical protein